MGHARGTLNSIGVLELQIPEEIGRPKFDQNVPGFVSGNGTFSFPIVTEIVEGVSRKALVLEADPKAAPCFVAAAQRLEQRGVSAITSNCGFTIFFQQQLAQAVAVPVFSSPLLFVPLVSRMLGEHRKVGLFTRHSKGLTENHFRCAGWSTQDTPIVLAGVEDFAAWQTWEKERYDLEQMGRDLVTLARQVVAREPEMGAIVFECALFPIWANEVKAATGLPVFDIIGLTTMVFAGLHRA